MFNLKKFNHAFGKFYVYWGYMHYCLAVGFIVAHFTGLMTLPGISFLLAHVLIVSAAGFIFTKMGKYTLAQK